MLFSLVLKLWFQRQHFWYFSAIHQISQSCENGFINSRLIFHSVKSIWSFIWSVSRMFSNVFTLQVLLRKQTWPYTFCISENEVSRSLLGFTHKGSVVLVLEKCYRALFSVFLTRTFLRFSSWHRISLSRLIKVRLKYQRANETHEMFFFRVPRRVLDTYNCLKFFFRIL